MVDAEKLLKANGVMDRVTVEAGDFFQSVPSGGDAYILSHILHDWNDDQCLTILGHCRKAMKPDGRLLIVEMVLPPGDAPHPGKILDMVMLVLIGGQERTEAEYAVYWTRLASASVASWPRIAGERGRGGLGLRSALGHVGHQRPPGRCPLAPK